MWANTTEAILTDLREKLPGRGACVAREMIRDNRRRAEDQAFGWSP